MADRAQILLTGREAQRGTGILNAMRCAARLVGVQAFSSGRYQPSPGWLLLWGAGAPDRRAARDLHVAAGHTAISFDLGYFGRHKPRGYARASVNHDHPWRLLDKTHPSPERWDAFGISIRQDANPSGHIVMVGMGDKSRCVEDQGFWEERKAAELRERFPGRRIVYRPKPRSTARPCGFEVDQRPDIADVLRGAALVVCRHSNVAVDAVVAGVPFECEDGAAYWLKGKPYTPEVRLDFLRRLCWWQWREDEADQAWRFLRSVARADRESDAS